MIPNDLKEAIREMYNDSANQHLTILLLVFTLFIISSLTLVIVKSSNIIEQDVEKVEREDPIYEESSLLISELH
jgi:hypothetical protein